MLTRKFIGYHGDRFKDASLLVYKNEKLIAVFPANSDGQTIYSHQGLSYGGLVLPKHIKLSDAFGCFYRTIEILRSKWVSKSHHQATPSSLSPAAVRRNSLCFVCYPSGVISKRCCDLFTTMFVCAQ